MSAFSGAGPTFVVTSSIAEEYSVPTDELREKKETSAKEKTTFEKDFFKTTSTDFQVDSDQLLRNSEGLNEFESVHLNECDERTSKTAMGAHMNVKHMVLHNGEKLLKCSNSVCDKSIKIDRTLAEHKAKHCEEEAFNCKQTHHFENTLGDNEILSHNTIFLTDSTCISPDTTECRDPLGNNLVKVESVEDQEWSNEETDLQETEGTGPISMDTSLIMEEYSDPLDEPPGEEASLGKKDQTYVEQHFPISTRADSNIESDQTPGNAGNPDEVQTPQVADRIEKTFKCPKKGCPMSYTKKSHLRVHQRSHSGHKAFKCKHFGCTWSFSKKSHLKLHETGHSSERIFRCPEPGCSKSYKTVYVLRKHIEVHINKKAYKCHYSGCKNFFGKKSELEEHMTLHNTDGVFKCDHPGCSWMFKKKSDLNFHKIVHREVYPYKCGEPGCSKSFKRKLGLKQHMTAHRDDGERFLCAKNGCLKKFKLLPSLIRHVKRRHCDDTLDKSSILTESAGASSSSTIENVSNSVEEIDPLAITISPKNTNQAWSIEQDSQIPTSTTSTRSKDEETDLQELQGNSPSSIATILKTEEYSDITIEPYEKKIFPAKNQDFPITTTDDFKLEPKQPLQNTEELNEVETVQPAESIKKIFKCPGPACTKTFKQQSQMRRHLKVHSDEKEFECQHPGCKKLFKWNYQRIKHERNHSNEETVKCDICSKTLKSKYYLKKHMVIHSDERPFKCSHPQCEKSFKMSNTLAEHEETHRDENTFKCNQPGCLRSFNRMRALRDHKKLHREGKKYKCDHPECPWTFKWESELNLHKIVHNVDKPYQCEYQGCPKSFKRKTDLKQHRSAHRSDGERLKCERDGCSKTFKWVANLIGHVKTHHPDDLSGETDKFPRKTNENCAESSQTKDSYIVPSEGHHEMEGSIGIKQMPVEEDVLEELGELNNEPEFLDLGGMKTDGVFFD